MQTGRVTHSLGPVFDERSKILVLGSIPSVKSREEGFYYANPRNRFWQVVSTLLACPLPQTVPQKEEMLKGAGIALFDVLYACDIEGSADASIKNAVPNDFSEIFTAADIRMVFANGKKAHQLYQDLCFPATGRQAVALPSTSPANAAANLPYLIREWSHILRYLDE
ncbi:MAG: DNA-deoxyinosine glycosylase [Christensenella sp.]|uniref:DNA-deoxyinosine glycosylase n=1 Tax=Christensenella sp. TaxID=1935934 RepID=UPI002B1EE8C2|nr:DNA-deoxyinosine glycosylase [Christensenella sp.]MEA5004011.1 DNA-deoxyinosine glycosylase [Christensenella sp.]